MSQQPQPAPRPWGTAENLPSAWRYRKWIVESTLPHIGDKPVLLAAGAGDYAQEWSAHGVTLTATEEDPELVHALTKRFTDDPNVRVRQLSLPAEEDADFSSVIALNVLEHVPDDDAVLRSLHRLVAPGGAAVIMVPACEIGMSRFDRSIGHLRRYSRRQLIEVVERAGWHVETVSFFNSLGLLAWVVAVRMLGMTPRRGLLLDVWDTTAIPVLRALEERVPPLLGKELFVVVRH